MLKSTFKLVPCLTLFLLFTICPPSFGQTGQIGFTTSQWITSFYLAYWNRVPDAEGHTYWMDLYQSGRLSIPEIAENFALQPEAKQTYKYLEAPHLATEEEMRVFVVAVYKNLFDREVSANSLGVVYWVNELQTKSTTPGAAIGNIINAAMQANLDDWLTVYKRVYLAEDMMRNPTAKNALCLKNNSTWNIVADESTYGDKLSINRELFTQRIMVGDEWCIENLPPGKYDLSIKSQTKFLN